MEIEINQIDEYTWKLTVKSGHLTNELELRKYDIYKLHEVATKAVNEINFNSK